MVKRERNLCGIPVHTLISKSRGTRLVLLAGFMLGFVMRTTARPVAFVATSRSSSTLPWIQKGIHRPYHSLTKSFRGEHFEFSTRTPTTKTRTYNLQHVKFSTCSPMMQQATQSQLDNDATNVQTSDTVMKNVSVTPPKKFVPFPFQYHEEVTLTVSSLTNLGMGVCRTVLPVEKNQNTTTRLEMNDAENEKESIETKGSTPTTEERTWVIMVPNVIPGETIRARIYRNFPSYSDADLLEILLPSPDRVEPPCSLSQICGGCQYQHMTIERQREWKRLQVQDCLERIGGFSRDSFPPVLPTVGTEEVYHYRSKITPHYDAPMPKRKKKKKQVQTDTSESGLEKESIPMIKAIGFKEKTSRRLVDVPHCHIATVPINEALVRLRENITAQVKDGTLRRPHRGATLLLREANEGVVTNPNQYVTATVRGLTFRFLAGNFFQNNPYVLPHMVSHVVEACREPSLSSSGEEEGLINMTHLIDCYCGSGLFCLSAAPFMDQCVGIEVNEKAIEEAQINAQQNGIDNCAFVAASAEAIFESEELVKQGATSADDKACKNAVLVRDFPRASTVVVVDPPRKGCSQEFLEQLYAFAPQRVVYMSCDPATQARDAKGLVANGYRIVRSVPFDLFPQTRHIESLVIFEKDDR